MSNVDLGNNMILIEQVQYTGILFWQLCSFSLIIAYNLMMCESESGFTVIGGESENFFFIITVFGIFFLESHS